MCGLTKPGSVSFYIVIYSYMYNINGLKWIFYLYDLLFILCFMFFEIVIYISHDTVHNFDEMINDTMPVNKSAVTQWCQGQSFPIVLQG